MKKSKYVVKCYVDYEGNHQGHPSKLIDIEEFGFNNLIDALTFLSECIDPITLMRDLIPEYKEFALN